MFTTEKLQPENLAFSPKNDSKLLFIVKIVAE